MTISDLGDRNGPCAAGMPSDASIAPNAAGQRFARIDTRQDADQGDADLNRGKESVRVLSQLEGLGGRLRCPAWRVHVQVRAARRDQRDFRHGEKPVEQDQQE